MFVTVTPNPSFDKTLRLPTLDRGEVHRVASSSTEAGGKGVNVGRALAQGGNEVVAVIPGSAADVSTFSAALGEIDGLTLVAVDGPPIRSNITIAEDDGTTTKLNASGEAPSKASTDALRAEVVDRANDATWVAVCGSHPPGFDSTFVAKLRDDLDSTIKIAVDASGAPLAEAVRVGVDLVKPNLEELEALVGRALPTVGDVVEAAHGLRDQGVEQVLVSLGADGALLIAGAGVLRGTTSGAVVRNTVGAGDAFLSGFLSGGGSGHTGLKEALAWGHAAVASPTTEFPPATDANRGAVDVTDQIDPATTLAESRGTQHGE